MISKRFIAVIGTITGIGAGSLAWATHHRAVAPVATPSIIPASMAIASEAGYTPSQFPGVYVRNIPGSGKAVAPTDNTVAASRRKLPGTKLTQMPHSTGIYIRPKPRIVNSPVAGGGQKALIDDNFMVADHLSVNAHAGHKSH